MCVSRMPQQTSPRACAADIHWATAEGKSKITVRPDICGWNQTVIIYFDFCSMWLASLGSRLYCDGGCSCLPYIEVECEWRRRMDVGSGRDLF
jgi:hypothetical protein